MKSTVTNVDTSKWLIEIDWQDEELDVATSTTIIGTEEDALSYVPTLARDYKENHPDLFPQPESEEGEHEEDFE